MTLNIITDQGLKSSYLMILAHGAGAGMEHSFMSTVAKGISALNGTVIRFNFGYKSEGKKFPGSPKKSIDNINEMVDYASSVFPDLPIILAGKSYGGRMSSHWAEQHTNDRVKALVYFGFPLHAPGKESTERARHLEHIRIPQLFLQGTNDKLADNRLINQVVSELDRADIVMIDQADHSFKVPKSSGKTSNEVLEELINISDKWVMDQLI